MTHTQILFLLSGKGMTHTQILFLLSGKGMSHTQMLFLFSVGAPKCRALTRCVAAPARK
jgi:hypothetical protein